MTFLRDKHCLYRGGLYGEAMTIHAVQHLAHHLLRTDIGQGEDALLRQLFLNLAYSTIDRQMLRVRELLHDTKSTVLQHKVNIIDRGAHLVILLFHLLGIVAQLLIGVNHL